MSCPHASVHTEGLGMLRIQGRDHSKGYALGAGQMVKCFESLSQSLKKGLTDPLKEP